MSATETFVAAAGMLAAIRASKTSNNGKMSAAQSSFNAGLFILIERNHLK